MSGLGDQQRCVGETTGQNRIARGITEHEDLAGLIGRYGKLFIPGSLKPKG